MKMDTILAWIKKKLAEVDWQLLVFLLLFMNVKLVVKLAGIVFIYLARRNFSFRFSLKQPAIPLFYPAMIGISLINFLIYSLYADRNYIVLLITGIGFWMLCILAFHQLLLSVKNQPIQKIHNAVFLFFLVNAVASCANLITIVVETGAINPYKYQGLYQKYFIGTGDYIRGITFDTSTTNAVLNAFGIVYFLLRKQMVMALLCMAMLLCTCSNFTNLLMIICLLYLLAFRSDRDQKSMIVVMFGFLVIFITNVSPENNRYTITVVERFFKGSQPQKNITKKIVPVTERPDSVLSVEERKFKFAKLYLDSIGRMLPPSPVAVSGTAIRVAADFKPEIPKANIHAPEYQHKQDSSEARFRAIALLRLMKQQTDSSKKNIPKTNQSAGKLVAFRQLGSFMKSHPARLVTGTGMGNFSSKLAFRVSGLKTSGGYPERFTYMSEAFKANHFTVYLNFVAKDSGYHSITNFPYSFYAQLLGEYGILGILCFLLFYVRFFTRDLKRLTYAIPIILIMAGAFVFDYWFEQLSVIVLFELLLLLNRKESAPIKKNQHA